jgi:hypothetical protein
MGLPPEPQKKNRGHGKAHRHRARHEFIHCCSL